MGSFSIWHWLIVLAVVVLVFGTKKLRNLGSDLGSAVKGFKDGLREGSDSADPKAEANPSQAHPNLASPHLSTTKPQGEVIDVQAHEKPAHEKPLPPSP